MDDICFVTEGIKNDMPIFVELGGLVLQLWRGVAKVAPNDEELLLGRIPSATLQFKGSQHHFPSEMECKFLKRKLLNSTSHLR